MRSNCRRDRSPRKSNAILSNGTHASRRSGMWRSKRSTSSREKMSTSCGTSARISTRRVKRAIGATGTRAKAPSSIRSSSAAWSNSASSRRRATPARSRGNSEGPQMRFGSRQATAVAVVAIGSVAAFSATSPHIAARTRTLATTVNWPLHNLDLAGSRYSTLDQINRSNVKSLVPRWLFQHGVIDGVSNQTTPIIVDGTMYVTDSRGSVYAVDAVDAKTGKVLWHFNTIPQDENDQGWDVAGPTWVGGERNGGGIWETAAIDPELGMLYTAVGNPFGDSSKRAGMNLFTDSIVALTLDTGRLEWYFQQTHHDVWDYDSGAPPILFDMQVRGRRVKALAEASKNGFLYILDRETGKPVHPIKEMPVPTDSAGAGESPWPSQPIPFTASGKPMEPVCPIEPLEIPAEQLAKSKPVPVFSPRRPNQISAPGTGGGTNYSPLSYSPRTGLLYVNAIDQPFNAGRGPKGYFSAYDPTTGELKWRKIFEGFGQAGSAVTAGDVVFVGTGSNIAGYFFAFDAKTGDELWKFNTGSGVFSSPSVYAVNGQEFVAVASGGGDRGRRGGDLILSFALPPR